ncbi:hypothetical protein QO034_10540 [Sedimentitalea sp. JM2-8]|uniref:Uncharacterized protein n=1 Tax=Sedimentitalea xiamensis TaxID=3050037 RepID=A0ABT7FEZ4_9RHOB|nr:hypothetical protein [Sedimentitalea xiamensis]MDK3073550.1 hypothetical protein [Sedimentitalea xiamensis]
MKQITGTDEMRFLGGGGGDAARLADLARRLGLIAEGDDPGLPAWESCLLDLRRALSGPRVSAELTCPDCGEGVALIFGIDDLPRIASPAVETAAGAALRPLRLSDLVAVEASGGDRLAQLLARAAGRDSGWAAGVLAGPDRDGAVTALERAVSGLDLEIGTRCTECGSAIVSPFDVQAFVGAELEDAARRLLDDVHRIASTYHWSEQDILALPRSRRMAYLGRIDRDALQLEITDVRR